MNIDEEIIENFKAHFADAIVSIDLSDKSVIDGKVMGVEVKKRVESPRPEYEITFKFVPDIKETKVEISR